MLRLPSVCLFISVYVSGLADAEASVLCSLFSPVFHPAKGPFSDLVRCLDSRKNRRNSRRLNSSSWDSERILRISWHLTGAGVHRVSFFVSAFLIMRYSEHTSHVQLQRSHLYRERHGACSLVYLFGLPSPRSPCRSLGLKISKEKAVKCVRRADGRPANLRSQL